MFFNFLVKFTKAFIYDFASQFVGVPTLNLRNHVVDATGRRVARTWTMRHARFLHCLVFVAVPFNLRCASPHPKVPRRFGSRVLLHVTSLFFLNE